ncbi:MAG: hypothetical protein ACON4Z_14555 [Planctomycetota bacterium]
MTKHGHGLPRKRPGRSAKDAIDAELPELEPLEDLPELEPIDELPELEAIEEDDGPVKGSCVESDEEGFDTVVTLDVPDMPKKEVLEAVEAPLERIAGAFGARLRHKMVLVRFSGDGLVGSAVKGVVAEKLAPQRPLKVVVKRGFGDEVVHEGALPTVAVTRELAGDATKVTVETGDCEPMDLPLAMAPHVVALVEGAGGGRFVFQFRGAGKPDSATREALAAALRDGGARSVAIGARVLFDLDVEEQVRCSVRGGAATIVVDLEADDEDAVDALSMVLPRDRAQLDGKQVRFEFARASAAVTSFCVDFARGAGATRVEVGAAGAAEIVWPPLVSVRAGKEVELRLTPNGRDRAALLDAFAQECAAHHDDTAGKDVVVDWPEGFELDDEAVARLEQACEAIAPRRLACTIHGDRREPFTPPPVHFGADGDVERVVVETEAGKPKELQRALDRRLPARLPSLSGKAVRIEAHGDAPLSRTLRDNLCGAVAEAGPTRLELAVGGEVDVMLPPMIEATEEGDRLIVRCDPGGRDEAQQRRAVSRELEGVEVALKAVLVEASPAARQVADFALEQGASRVVLGGDAPMQIHPPLFELVEKKGKQARLVVEPTGDAAMEARMVEAELPGRLEEVGALAGVTVTVTWPEAGADTEAVTRLVDGLRSKRAAKVLLDRGDGEPLQLHPEPAPVAAAPEAAADEASTDEAPTEQAPPPAAATPGALLQLVRRIDNMDPPVVVVSVADGDDDAHLAAVLAELEQALPRFVGRAVLLVPQRDGVDAPVRRRTRLAELLAQAVPQAAAATLLFRGGDAEGRAHFEVLHSLVPHLPAGATFADPRAK